MVRCSTCSKYGDAAATGAADVSTDAPPFFFARLSGADLTGLSDEEIKARFYGNSEAQLIYRSYINAVSCPSAVAAACSLF